MIIEIKLLLIIIQQKMALTKRLHTAAFVGSDGFTAVYISVVSQ